MPAIFLMQKPTAAMIAETGKLKCEGLLDVHLASQVAAQCADCLYLRSRFCCKFRKFYDSGSRKKCHFPKLHYNYRVSCSSVAARMKRLGSSTSENQPLSNLAICVKV